MLSDEDRSVSRGEYFVSGILSNDSHNTYFTQSKIMPEKTLQNCNCFKKGNKVSIKNLS